MSIPIDAGNPETVDTSEMIYPRLSNVETCNNVILE
jgi:hypothetical protein